MHTPHPHSCKHDGKVVIAVVHHVLGFLHQTGLPTNLSCNLVKRYLILIVDVNHLSSLFFTQKPTSLCGRPAAEKMGIFWPLAMLFIPSMADIPVWIISSG